MMLNQDWLDKICAFNHDDKYYKGTLVDYTQDYYNEDYYNEDDYDVFYLIELFEIDGVKLNEKKKIEYCGKIIVLDVDNNNVK